MKYIFWDFNGTILDDLDLCLDILNKMLVNANKQPITKKRYLDIFTFPIKEYYLLAGFDFDETPFDKLAIDYINQYQQASLSQKLHPDLVKTVKLFNKKGIKQVILSASEKNNLIEQTNHFKITNLFVDVLGINDIYAKSKQSVLEKYLVEKNIGKNDIIIIGDTLHDAEIALAVGASVILYTRGHQAKKRLGNYRTIDSYQEIWEEF